MGGAALQLDPHPGQHRLRPGDGRRVDVVRQLGDGEHQRPEGGDVAEPAMCLFEVRLEEEGDVPMGGVTLRDLF